MSNEENIEERMVNGFEYFVKEILGRNCALTTRARTMKAHANPRQPDLVSKSAQYAIRIELKLSLPS